MFIRTIFMTKLIVTIIVMLPGMSHAIFCMPEAGDPGKVHDYMKAIVTSLEFLREARDNDSELANAKKSLISYWHSRIPIAD